MVVGFSRSLAQFLNHQTVPVPRNPSTKKLPIPGVFNKKQALPPTTTMFLLHVIVLNPTKSHTFLHIISSRGFIYIYIFIFVSVDMINRYKLPVRNLSNQKPVQIVSHGLHISWSAKWHRIEYQQLWRGPAPDNVLGL